MTNQFIQNYPFILKYEKNETILKRKRNLKRFICGIFVVQKRNETKKVFN